MTDKVLQSKSVIVKEMITVCPHCQWQNEGWIVDPRGRADTCEHCGKEYTVDPDAQVYFGQSNHTFKK